MSRRNLDHLESRVISESFRTKNRCAENFREVKRAKEILNGLLVNTGLSLLKYKHMLLDRLPLAKGVYTRCRTKVCVATYHRLRGRHSYISMDMWENQEYRY